MEPMVSSAWRLALGWRRRKVCHQGMARCASDALADTVQEMSTDHGRSAIGKRRHRLLSAARAWPRMTRPCADADDHSAIRGRPWPQRPQLRQFLRSAPGSPLNAQCYRQKHRSQAMDHFRGISTRPPKAHIARGKHGCGHAWVPDSLGNGCALYGTADRLE